MRNVVVMQAPGCRGDTLHPGPTRDVLVTLAVSPEGRRRADAPLAGDTLHQRALAVLDHAGPRASSWLTERALSATSAPDVMTGRAPLALDDAGWARIVADFARAADACRAVGVPFVLGAHDDGLLHTALSPRASGTPSTAAPTSIDGGLQRVLEVHRAVGGADVVIVVEELCPRGFDATDGIAIARALVGQGARRIYAAAGTDALPPLRRRQKGTHGSDPRHAAHAALASACWLVGRVDAEIVAVIPRGAPGLLADAAALGLAGVVVEEHS